MGYQKDFENRFQELKGASFKKLAAELTSDADPFMLEGAALGALVDADHESIPDQRPALRALRAAVEAVHPAALEQALNPPGPMPPEMIVDKDAIVGWIDEAIASWGDGRPPNARESAIIRGVAHPARETRTPRVERGQAMRKPCFDPREQPVTPESVEAAKAAAQAEREATGIPIDESGRILLPGGLDAALELASIRNLCGTALRRTQAVAPHFPEAARFFAAMSANLAGACATFDSLIEEDR